MENRRLLPWKTGGRIGRLQVNRTGRQVYEYSASSASSDRRPSVENQPEPSVENDPPRWSREPRRRDWLRAIRRRATDALYEVIDAGFRIAAKFGRPNVTHRTTEETRPR